MIFQEKPEGFSPKFEVVSCFLEHDGKILLLHRQDHKPEGDTWGVPAGKVDSNEDIYEATLREIREETGVSLGKEQLTHGHKLFVRYPGYDFFYHIFHAALAERPVISISSNEHKTYTWVTPQEALGMNLIQDEDACINLFYFNK